MGFFLCVVVGKVFIMFVIMVIIMVMVKSDRNK